MKKTWRGVCLVIDVCDGGLLFLFIPDWPANRKIQEKKLYQFHGTNTETHCAKEKGNKWSKDTVTHFLQNEFFYGKVAYRDEL